MKKKNPGKRKNNRILTTIILEQELIQQDFQRIIGIDEVGRGCWAGPVYVAGFAFTVEHQPVKGVTDSKLLQAKTREKLAEKLILTEHKVLSGEVSEINRIGVGRTIEDQICSLIEYYNDASTYFLIDGHFSRNFGKNTRQIIKGDLKHYAIAAASIIAKVSRDKFMQELSERFPEFNFAVNKGYATANHRQAIDSYGITPWHRTSFAPIKNILEQIKLI